MIERETICQGLSHAAWGYFLLGFDFNLNGISILPRFAGFWLLLSAINRLSGARRDLKLLRPLCLLLTGWSGLDWLLSWRGGQADGHIPFLDLLVLAAALYFQFQFLTDMAALAEQYQPERLPLSGRIRRHRTAYTLLYTAACLLSGVGFSWDWRLGMTAFVMLLTLLVDLMLMADLFRLRKCVSEAPPPFQ